MVTHCEGIGILFVAFPLVSIVLSANLSVDEDFNGISELKLFINQPVEVRVRCGGLVYQLGKISGGVLASFKFFFLPKVSIPTAL